MDVIRVPQCLVVHKWRLLPQQDSKFPLRTQSGRLSIPRTVRPYCPYPHLGPQPQESLTAVRA
jgi:hypothetical protein